ncbi:histidine triad nucleotide-binding protein [Jeongeupia naejangsanensis]|uniref:Histidine triad nucleotide-binding protein n=1 Tax=Jeongeupia naejangsanensis TaxID=613195 RepID=A0ABS2BLF5_9NEIS|nr:histidine triad nucleotide-binding protein [Jeongeupia naejangsanensis]MBM3115913.1 histidine triad nucleotide-binding protein [Jeongeupia naejangsanensis]
MSDCIFCKLAKGEFPTTKLYEDDDILVFNDLHPVAPVHFLVVPKPHIESLAHAEVQHQALLGKLMLVAARVAAEQGLAQGFRTIINTGEGGGQSVFHLHLHVIGGAPLPTKITELSTH